MQIKKTGRLVSVTGKYRHEITGYDAARILADLDAYSVNGDKISIDYAPGTGEYVEEHNVGCWQRVNGTWKRIV